MAWQLHARFQELEVRDSFWEQVITMPQLRPLLESSALRTRLYLVRPVVAFEHNDREALAPLARWLLDFWPSAQISLSQGDRSILSLGEETQIYLETGPS
jgi:hypothetical protein